jgi:hypothetical protein
LLLSGAVLDLVKLDTEYWVRLLATFVGIPVVNLAAIKDPILVSLISF